MTEKVLKEIAKIFVGNNGWCSKFISEDYPIMEQLSCDECPFASEGYPCTTQMVYKKACGLLAPEELFEVLL